MSDLLLNLKALFITFITRKKGIKVLVNYLPLPEMSYLLLLT